MARAIKTQGEHLSQLLLVEEWLYATTTKNAYLIEAFFDREMFFEPYIRIIPNQGLEHTNLISYFVSMPLYQSVCSRHLCVF